MNRIAQIAARANNLRKPDNAQYCILWKVAEIAAVCSPLPTRFLRKVHFRSNGCWEWIGGNWASIRGSNPEMSRLEKIAACIEQANDRKLLRLLNRAWWREWFRNRGGA